MCIRDSPPTVGRGAQLQNDIQIKPVGAFKELAKLRHAHLLQRVSADRQWDFDLLLLRWIGVIAQPQLRFVLTSEGEERFGPPSAHLSRIGKQQTAGFLRLFFFVMAAYYQEKIVSNGRDHGKRITVACVTAIVVKNLKLFTKCVR